jgi:phosphatidylserine decarboxylase
MPRAPLGRHAIEPARPVERGEEIGIFHLGSTAVVFFEPKVRKLDRSRGPVRLGEALHPL